MLVEPIDVAYFDWLCAKVLPPHTRNYATLLEKLFCTEFVWIVPGDKNRLEDGIELRQYFVNETGWERDQSWYNEPCSLLEYFLAFANRASFQTDISVRDWFWTFMTNLGLDEYRQVADSEIPMIEGILDTFVWRKYDSLGRGGMFPLSESDHDQRQEEGWYQFNEYVIDQGLV